MKLIETITIPNFITEVKLSDKRRAKFFDIGAKLPKKYSKFLGKKYEFRNHKIGNRIIQYLTDIKLEKKLLKILKFQENLNLRRLKVMIFILVLGIIQW
jgi:hypothetical protein